MRARRCLAALGTRALAPARGCLSETATCYQVLRDLFNTITIVLISVSKFIAWTISDPFINRLVYKPDNMNCSVLVISDIDKGLAF